MRRHAGWLILAATLFLILGGSVYRAHAQSNALSMSLSFGGRILPTINLNQAALVPQCSATAGCKAVIMLCNVAATNFGSAPGGCIAINGGNLHTVLKVSITDMTQAAGTTSPVSANFPVGSIDISELPPAETNSIP